MDRARVAFLERFLGTISPSGFETEAAAVWRKEAEKYAERTWVDLHGNAFASLNESGTPRVMLAGHMDEIGFMVRMITKEGFVKFVALGGWWTRYCSAIEW